MRRPVPKILLVALLWLLFSSTGCFRRKIHQPKVYKPKIYKPPAMGAESRFDDGLKPEKHKKRLFDKDMRKYLEEKGMPGGG